jgi:hypothetical protein
MWRGKRIEELTRDELIEALHLVASELEQHRTPAAIRAHALGCVEMLKRGERRFA